MAYSSQQEPPKSAERILKYFLKDELFEEVSGDLYEKYVKTVNVSSNRKARLNYWIQVLNYLRPFAIKKSKSINSNYTIMLRNNLLIAFRNLSKHRFHATINIMSLAIGFAACLVIFLFIADEKSFDQQHSKKDNLYRLCEVQSFPGTKVQEVALSMPGMGPSLLTDFPEVESYCRVWQRGKRVWEKGEHQFPVRKVLGADSTFFEFFDYPLIAGDRSTVLDEPNSIVISESTAKLIFGSSEAVGQTLKMNDNTFRVTGVFKDVPENSHLQFNVLISITTVTAENPEFNERWGSNYVITYLVLNPNADLDDMAKRYPDYLIKNSGEDEINDYYKLFLQQWNDVHLTSSTIEHDYLNYRKFNGAYLDVFVLVGVFILIIASVNFMNLTTARASNRAKEVGVRKTVGAQRKQLFIQFIVESVLMSVIAFIIALVIDGLGLNFLNDLIDRKLDLMVIFVQWQNIVVIVGVVLVLGVLAGLYPSLYLSNFKPAVVLKGMKIKGKKSLFRSTLIITQFSLVIAMIVATMIVLQQLDFMSTKDIGFSKDHILLVDMDGTANEKYDVIKQRLLQSSNVLGVTASGQRLGNNFHQWGAKVELDTGITNFTPSNVLVHYDYTEVYEMDLIEGRSFSKDYSQDDGLAFVVNEALVKQMGLKNPVGTKMAHSWYPNDSMGTIIGVVRDFNFNSLHHRVNTLSLVVHTEWGYDEMSIKLNGDHIEAGIAEVEKIWEEMVPEFPIEYSFLDDHMNDMYQTDQQMSAVISIIAILSILIGSMGLFGLSAIATERRIKEIGIRKVLGANIQQLLAILTKHFAWLILLSFVIASPITYFFLADWLANFAFSIEMNVWLFILAGLVAMLIAILTISYHTLRAARKNPVHSLRYE